MKQAFPGMLALALAATGLAGCGSEEVEEEAPSWVDPEAPAGIEVSEGRLMLPAVSGNPAAIYFTLRNEGKSDQTVSSVFVSGAQMASIHETTSEGRMTSMQDAPAVLVPAGETTEFAPGVLHVMAMQVSEALEDGGETEVTLTFASGDKVSFPVEITAPGLAGESS